MTDRRFVKKWQGSVYREVFLPSGLWVRGVLPSAEMLVRKNLLPNDLVEMAKQFGAGGAGIDPEEMEAEDRSRFLSFMRHLVAHFLRHGWTGEHSPRETAEDEREGLWEPITMTADEIDHLDLPEDDMDALQAIVLRRVTPRTVTTLTLLDFGKMEQAEAERIVDEEAGATEKGWGGFRHLAGGPARGRDGEALRSEAEQPARGNRAARRAGARSGARTPARS